MMHRIAIIGIGVLVLIACTGAPAEAQHVDFSGTWTLDPDASEVPQGRGGGRGGGSGRAGGGFGGGGPATVTITQTDDEVVMEQQVGGRSQTVTYRLDGGPSENSGPRGGMATTTSSWDDAALVTEGSQMVSTPRGELTLESHERRTLSDGGQTMTITTTRTTPRGDVTATLVYRKSTG